MLRVALMDGGGILIGVSRVAVIADGALPFLLQYRDLLGVAACRLVLDRFLYQLEALL